MKEKLLAVWSKVKPVLAKIYSVSPLACGIALGYLAHPLIKASLDLTASTLRWLLN